MKNGLKKILAITLLLINLNTSHQLKNLRISFQYLDKISEPVIGILTIPLSKKLKKTVGEEYEAYVPSSYKKWVEQTGARPIVIPHFLSIEKIKKIMDQANGIVFPGGAPDLEV